MANKRTNIMEQGADPFDTLFENQEQTKKAAAATKGKKGRPVKQEIVRANTAQKGLPEDYTRATFILHVDTLEKLKDYAYTERLSMKEAINKLLSSALASEEKKLTKKGIELLHKGDK